MDALWLFHGGFLVTQWIYVSPWQRSDGVKIENITQSITQNNSIQCPTETKSKSILLELDNPK